MLSIIKKIIPKSAGEESVYIIGLYKCSDQEKILCNYLWVCPKTIVEFGTNNPPYSYNILLNANSLT